VNTAGVVALVAVFDLLPVIERRTFEGFLATAGVFTPALSARCGKTVVKTLFFFFLGVCCVVCTPLFVVFCRSAGGVSLVRVPPMFPIFPAARTACTEATVIGGEGERGTRKQRRRDDVVRKSAPHTHRHTACVVRRANIIGIENDARVDGRRGRH